MYLGFSGIAFCFREVSFAKRKSSSSENSSTTKSNWSLESLGNSKQTSPGFSLRDFWDFVKSPWNDEIALQHFFFLLAAVQEFFFYFICAACNFFLPTRACRKFFFEIIHPPPQELNGRPLSSFESEFRPNSVGFNWLGQTTNILSVANMRFF